MLLTSWLGFRRPASPRDPAEQHRAKRRTARRLHVERLEDRLCLSGGYLLVSDYDTNSVLRYDAATGAFVDTFVPKHSGGLNQPEGMIFGPHDHNLYVTSGEVSPSDQHTAVLRYDGTTGAFIDEFANSGHIDGPHAVIFGPDGNLYVAQGLGSEGQVVRYNGTTGAFMDDFVPPNSGGLARPFALVFGPSGRGPRDLDIYVVSRLNDSVKRYDGTTGAYLGDFVASGSGGLDAPIGLTFGPDGNLYVSAGFLAAPSAVFRFQGPTGPNPGAPMPSPGNGGAIFVASGSGGLLTTFALIFGPDGNGDGRQDLYLPSFKTAGWNKADHKFSTIKRYDGVNGAFIDTFVTPNSGGLDQPSYLIFTETDPVTLAYTGTKKTSSIVASPTPLAQESSDPVWTGTAVDSTTISSLLSASLLVAPNRSGSDGADLGTTFSTQSAVGPQPLADNLAGQPHGRAANTQAAEILDQALAEVVTQERTSHFGLSPELDWDTDLLTNLALASELA